MKSLYANHIVLYSFAYILCILIIYKLRYICFTAEITYLNININTENHKLNNKHPIVTIFFFFFSYRHDLISYICK